MQTQASPGVRYFEFPFGKQHPHDELRYFLVKRTDESPYYKGVKEGAIGANEWYSDPNQAKYSADLLKIAYSAEIDGLMLLQPNGSHSFLDFDEIKPRERQIRLEYLDYGSW